MIPALYISTLVRRIEAYLSSIGITSYFLLLTSYFLLLSYEVCSTGGEVRFIREPPQRTDKPHNDNFALLLTSYLLLLTYSPRLQAPKELA